MPKFNRKTTLIALVATFAIISGGGVAAVSYLNNQEKQSAKAVEVMDKVKEKPEAGIEELPAETMESVNKSITTYPGFIVRGELDRQLKEGYITQKQHKQLNELVDKHEATQKPAVTLPTE